MADRRLAPALVAAAALVAFAGGVKSGWGHLQSLSWHLGAALLVWALARQLLSGGALGPLAAGLLFAVHPFQSEAVDNLSSREDLMAAFFALAAVLLALRGTRRALAAAAICFLAALFSRETALAVPLLVAGAWWCQPGRAAPARPRLLVPSALALAALAWLAARFGLFKEVPAEEAALLAAPRVFAHGLRLLVYPRPLCAGGAGMLEVDPQALLSSLAPVSLVVAWLVAAVLLAPRHRVAAYGMGWFAVTLLPAASLLPAGVGERLFYLPVAGMALAAGAAAQWLGDRLPRRARPGALAAGAAIFLALALATHARHADWRDDLALWSAAVRDCPESWIGHARLGAELGDRGQRRRAAEEFEAALALEPPRGERPELLRQQIAGTKP